MNTAYGHRPLHWIKDELEGVILEARQALEGFVERHEGDRAAARCIERLHQVHGILQMVQLSGPASLAGEMERLAAALRKGQVENFDKATDALMGAHIRLPEMLERFREGAPDTPLLLLDEINELRAARGASLLTEAAFFFPDIAGAPLPERVDGAPNPELPGLVARLRPQFHKGLLDWYRGEDPQAGLQHLRAIFQGIAEDAHTAPVWALFHVAQGVAEGLIEGAIEPGGALKTVIGRLDHVLKPLMADGEAGIPMAEQQQLLTHLLYVIARADSGHPLLRQIKADFRLADALPDADEVEAGRKRLHVPGVALFESVSDALKAEMTQVKDGLDLFIRGDRDTLDELTALIDPLQKMADTLGVLGHAALRQELLDQVDVIREIADGRAVAGDAELMEIASKLLYVESAMGDLTTQQPDRGAAVAGNRLPQMPQNQFLQLIEHTMQEAGIDLNAVKAAIESYAFDGGGTAELERAGGRLQRIAGALRMLDHEGAAALLDRANRYISDHLLDDRPPPPREELDAMADLITGIELYMEGVVAGGQGLEKALQTARSGAERLPAGSAGPAVDTVATQPSEVVPFPTQMPGEEAPVPAVSEAGGVEAENDGEGDTDGQVLETLDPEMLEIFIEEAREELESIEDYVPRWKENTDDKDALINFRRSFHTLKGSGRLVGANTIGEFAWSIEHLLNQVIDRQVAPSPALFAVLDETMQVLPDMIDAQEEGRAPTGDFRAVMARARTLAEGGEIAVETPPTEEIPPPEPEAAATPETPAAPIVMDAALAEVFITETRTHLREIESFLNRCRETPATCLMDEEQARTFHTLKGSARVAEVTAIAEVSRALEGLATALAGQGKPLDAEVLDLIEDSARRIEEIIETINAPNAALPEVDDLMARIAAYRTTLEEEIPAGVALSLEARAAQAAAEEEGAEAADLRPREIETTEETQGQAPEDAETAEQPEGTQEKEEAEDEIAAIFVEEAGELLDELDGGLSLWRENGPEQPLFAGLQRTLHTLKGGARLAELGAIGDLSHALEALFAAIAEERLEASAERLDLAQRASDRLVAQIEQVNAGGGPEPADDLVAALQTALEPHAEEEAPEAAPEAEPAEDEIVPAAEVEGPAPEEQEPVEVDETPTTGATTPEAAVVSEDEESASSAEESPAVEEPPAAEEPPQVIPMRPPRVMPAPRVVAAKGEQVKVSSDLLDRLVNDAGEISIFRARLEQQGSALGYNLEELDQTIARLHGQLRKLDIETEAQILHRVEREQWEGGGREDFDPLEFDRFSTMQQLSRSLMETVNDLLSIKTSLTELQKETDTLLLQQARLSTDLQEGLLRTRMVAFSTLVPRLQRLVRQTCATLGKQAELEVRGADGEMDRAILDRMVAPLEHILRNAISHGIETPDERQAAGKPRHGRIRLELGREGGEVMLVVSDDGVGFNLASIRQRAVERGLLAEDAQISDHDLMQFVLESGFSTAEEVTQVAGRGVGMDVVANEVKQLGGSLQIGSRPGEGTWFTIRLPFTLAIAQGMLVQLGDEIYAVPHAGVEGVVRIGRDALEACYAGSGKGFSYAGRTYPVRYLGQLLGVSEPELPKGRRWFPMLLVRVGEQRLALQVDALLGNRQIVVKSVGAQLSTVRWVSGGTILSDGRVALILDVHALARMAAAQTLVTMEKPTESTAAPDVTVMVVDDSITVRKVTRRLLERHHLGVILAKDGQDALAKLEDQRPDVMLLDIEMPRMDGYELARHMRNDPRLRDIPVIMITSRVGDKHRRRAEELGVKRYLGKPYQETELMDNIFAVLAEAYA